MSHRWTVGCNFLGPRCLLVVPTVWYIQFYSQNSATTLQNLGCVKSTILCIVFSNTWEFERQIDWNITDIYWILFYTRSIGVQWPIFTMKSSNGNISCVTGLCVGNSPVTAAFPSQRPVTRSFDGFFDLRLSKQSRRRWFKTPLHSL